MQEVIDEPNDGVVTRSSAEFGELQQPFWDAITLEMVGHNLDTADLIHRFYHFSTISPRSTPIMRPFIAAIVSPRHQLEHLLAELLARIGPERLDCFA